MIAAGPASAVIVEDSTLTIYRTAPHRTAPHGLADTQKRRLCDDLLAFLAG